MCGFIGQISETKGGRDLLRALPWLQRRGPDSWRIWSSSDRRISLLHSRLAIVDKDPRSNQPFCDAQAGITVAFIGEIYNYHELKDKFSHYHFRTGSDTEVIIAAYVDYKTNGLSLLKGMFSLVIVDEKLKKIILARDPIGKKPLFLARWQDNVLFGSSVLALAAVNKRPVEINTDVLNHFWENSFVPAHTSLLSGVMPVLPGEVLELDWQGNLLRETCLEPEKLHLYNGESLDEVNKTVKILLENAVRSRLTHNPQPTVLLSGGIDSTLVCAMAQKICHEDKLTNLQVITLKSFIPLMNDEFYARFAASRLGLVLRLVKLRTDKLGDSIIKAIDLQDEPLGMPSFFLLARLVNAASSYGRIILSGDGGDEVFLGYGKPSDWYEASVVKRTNKTNLKYGPEIPFWMSDWARKTVSDVLVGHMLAKVDRASAEQAVEIRCPLLDWDLVSYARSLPFKILAHGGRTKALLKEQLSGWPRWFLERPKIGFAYNLRWHWALSNFSGLRETIDRRAMDTFEKFIPPVLQRNSADWRTKDIFRNFEACWRLLVWSRFLLHLDQVPSG